MEFLKARALMPRDPVFIIFTDVSFHKPQLATE
jgi:hypothetical protein